MSIYKQNPGYMPLDPDTKVNVLFKSGIYSTGKAGTFVWECIGTASDIISYREEDEKEEENSSANPVAELLQEIADEAKVNKRFWTSFEKKIDIGWRTFSTMRDLFDAIDRGDKVRKKPSYVRVEVQGKRYKIPRVQISNLEDWLIYQDSVVEARGE